MTIEEVEAMTLTEGDTVTVEAPMSELDELNATHTRLRAHFPVEVRVISRIGEVETLTITVDIGG